MVQVSEEASIKGRPGLGNVCGLWGFILLGASGLRAYTEQDVGV